MLADISANSSDPVNRVTVITPLDFFADFKFAGVKTHKIGYAAKRIGPAVHLLVSSAGVLGSNLGHQPKGRHVPFGWCTFTPSSGLGYFTN